jgi:hypothetical protein
MLSDCFLLGWELARPALVRKASTSLPKLPGPAWDAIGLLPSGLGAGPASFGKEIVKFLTTVEEGLMGV